MPNNINIDSNGDVKALADSLGGFAGGQTGHNDTYDAFKHAYGSAVLAGAYGDSFTKFWMDRREIGTPRDEQNMDKWNNDIGRKEYHSWKEARDAGTTSDSLEKWIYDRVKEGKTINDLNDTSKCDEPPRSNALDFIRLEVNKLFKFFSSYAPPSKDPLTLDLDGDGLETVGTSAGILFDHDGDGVKTGSGWVSADDGFLVLDRNGNNVIDDGRELFGDSTVKSNGQTAVDGFDALRKSKGSDSNGTDLSAMLMRIKM